MHTKTETATLAPASEKLKRQYVRFAFYKLDPTFRKLDANIRLQAKEEVLSLIDLFREKMILLSYSLLATRADADLMFWQVSDDLDVFDNFASRLIHSGMGPYLHITHSFLSMTRHTVYVDKINPEHSKSRIHIKPGDHKYLFVYPFVKTHEWYQLPMAERQKMMDQHIVMGNKYPSVKINTTYSFGLDDPDFVLAFESDSPEDFLDLVMEMRGAKARLYTLKDTPIFTCIAKDPKWILDSIG